MKELGNIVTVTLLMLLLLMMLICDTFVHFCWEMHDYKYFMEGLLAMADTVVITRMINYGLLTNTFCAAFVHTVACVWFLEPSLTVWKYLLSIHYASSGNILRLITSRVCYCKVNANPSYNFQLYILYCSGHGAVCFPDSRIFILFLLTQHRFVGVFVSARKGIASLVFVNSNLLLSFSVD